MTSTLSWVDYSYARRDDLDRLLDALRDKSTVNELGVDEAFFGRLEGDVVVDEFGPHRPTK